MARKRKAEESGGGAPEWMCTFSDMMSLLLCFFILLFAMSNLEEQKFIQAIGSIQGALGRIPGMFNMSFVPPISNQPQQAEPVQRSKTIERAKEAIAKKARSRLVADENSKEVIVEGVREGIRFSLSGRLLFPTGTANLTPEGQKILDSVAISLAEFPDLRIRIEGHTDSNPVPPSSIYRDNWRLSQARALSTLIYLRDQVSPPENRIQDNRFSIMACAEVRPRFPNDTPENRSLNRRVEIVLLQGHNSEAITGALEGTSETRVNPEESDYTPLK